MRNQLFLSLLGLAAAQILSASVTTNISTGQAPLDPIWTITAGGMGPALVITSPIIPPWVAPPPGSAWVSTTTSNLLPPSTTYSLETSFTLNSPGGVLEYRALADNELRVYIDGALTPDFTFIGVFAGDFSTLPGLQTVNFASAGLHTVRLDVTNVSGFSGVLFTGTVTDVPEPSTFGAIGTGLVLAGWWKRRSSV
jgi:hypothetical protein